MAKLTPEMKEMLDKQLPYLATVTDADSLLPNIGPKRSLRLWDDETLIYNENTGRQHFENVKEGSKAAVAIVDRDQLDGYRFVGPTEVFTEGEVWDAAIEFAERMGHNPPKAAVLIHVEQIYTLMLGKNAGRLLDSDDKTDLVG